MIIKKINGYTIEVAQSQVNHKFRFVTLIDEKGQRYYFNMDKLEQQWIIRNPDSVPTFIVEIENDISAIV